MPQSVLGNVIEFFGKIGIYDVVLPFLLVFTIVFAILEKTKVLGTEKVEGEVYPRKNLNAMAAFVIGFLVVASAQLVEAITRISANVVLLLMLAVFFLMLVGTFFPSTEEVALKGGWRNSFMVIMFVGIVFVFLAAIKTQSGASWLDIFWQWITSFWTSTAVASIILMIVIVIFLYFIVTGGPKEKEKEKTGESST